ncbi:hypothetical protein D7Z54_14010 [Salibacterium salarium]|uniref:Flagellar hook-length control protein-like C-terminal domain-containing protein n=1 Tax=Salibacterium salarium TaxID=284579 RepID=A0A3R9Q3J5_9BACI|nr:flagellar hook-length control protein FliK [Salibacterium salarium]RSL32853.1 hypothetical protein D7Z54_14010 [Salibacterium salarium]
MQMQMLMQTLPTSKLSGQQSASDSLELPDGEGKEGFMQLLGKAMTHKMTDGNVSGEDGESASMEELLGDFFGEGKQLIDSFGEQLKSLFEEGAFEWSDEMQSFIDHLPEEMQAITDMLTELDNKELLALVEGALSGTSVSSKGEMIEGEEALTESDSEETSKLLDALQEFIGSQDNQELIEKLEDMSTDEEMLASSLTGLLAIINQTVQQTSFDAGKSGVEKQVSPEFSNKLASLVNSFTPTNQTKSDGNNPQKMIEQMSRLLENQSGQQTQTKSMEALTQQLKQTASSEADAKNNYLQQLLNRGLSSTDTTSSKAQPTSLGTQESTGVMAKAQQAVLYLGEGKTEQARSQEFVKQFQDLLGKSNLQSFKNGTQQLTLKLHPEHLGRLDVKLTQQNGQLTAQLLTTTKTARDMVESQIQQLRTTFQQQNIQVDRIEIQQQQTSNLQQEDGKQEQQEQTGEQQDNQQEQSGDENTETFAEMLDELTFNEQV